MKKKFEIRNQKFEVLGAPEARIAWVLIESGSFKYFEFFFQ